jgi:hypothetical protein
VKKKMIHRFPISLVQATSVHNDDMPLPEIVHSKDLVKGYRPRKKKLPSKEPKSATHFQRKPLLSEQVKDLKKDLTLNKLFLEKGHQSLSA